MNKIEFLEMQKNEGQNFFNFLYVCINSTNDPDICYITMLNEDRVCYRTLVKSKEYYLQDFFYKSMGINIETYTHLLDNISEQKTGNSSDVSWMTTSLNPIWMSIDDFLLNFKIIPKTSDIYKTSIYSKHN